MSTTKRGVSLLLCRSMLVSMFSILGAIMPKAHAAEGESRVKSYEECMSDFGAGFVYYAVDFYEIGDADWVLTDHYVDAGDVLKAQIYIKSSRYMGSSTAGLVWSSNMFEHDVPASSTSGGGTPEVCTVNVDHPAGATVSNGGWGAAATRTWRLGSVLSNGVVRTTNLYLAPAADPMLDEEITASWCNTKINATQFLLTNDATNKNQVWPVTSDEWYFEFLVTVKEGLENGTTGFVMSPQAFWKTASKPSPWDFKWSDNASTGAGGGTSLPSGSADSVALMHMDDTKHVFTIGPNPDDGSGDDPTTPTEGTSQVKSFEDCLDAFGVGFIYYAVDIYENDGSDWILTDHYVEAGDTLKARIYIKSTRYMGSSTAGLVWSSNMFEHDVPASSTSGGGTPVVCTVNVSHPAGKTVAAGGWGAAATRTWRLGSVLTNGVVRTTNNYLTPSDDPMLDESITSEWCNTKINATQFLLTNDATNKNKVWPVTSDEWYFEFEVTVKEGLEEGTTGFVMSPQAFWKTASKPSPWDFKWSDNENTAAGGGTSLPAGSADSVALMHMDDTKHIFTIGSAGPAVKKYKANFYEDKEKTDLIQAFDLEEGEAVTAPESIANQLGWADLATGEMVTSFPTMGKKTLNYLRVMRDDAFDVVVNLNGGELETVPEGVTDNGDGTVSISSPMNCDVDLSVLTPKKEGYTASFDPEIVTMDNINGKNVSVTWTPNTYHVSLYLEKGDAEPWNVLDIAYGSALRGKVNAAKPTKEGFAFIKWLNVEDDSDVIPNTLTEAKDLAYYATWNELDSSFAYMIYDYSAEDWKEAGKVYGNSGDTLAISTVNTFRNKLTAADFGLDTKPDYAIGSNAYTVDGTGYSATATTATLTFDGAKEIFINTKLAANVTFSVPVYDEETESYGDATQPITVPVVPDNNAAETTVTVYKTDVKAQDYYSLTGWVDNATGAPVENVNEKANAYEFTLDLREPHDIVAVYELTKYHVLTYIGDSGNTAYLSDQGFALGEEIDLYALTFSTYPDGESSPDLKIPQVGHVNTMDPDDGTLQVTGRDGYEMTGWIEFGSKKDIAPTFTLTKEVLYKGNLMDNTNLALSAVWAAENYDADFYYIDANGQEVLYKTISAPTGAALSNFRPDRGEDTDAVHEEINAAAPAGKVFAGTWTPYLKSTGEQVDTTEDFMHPGGMKYVAVYNDQGITVYQHFNNENAFDEDGNPILKRYATPKYGEHLLAGYLDPEAAYDEIGAGTEILNIRFPDTSDEKPEETQTIGWKTYHVLDEADLNNPDKWIEGINEITDSNDPDYDVVKYPTIFQAQWKPNRDFFFRVYGETKVILTLPINGEEFSVSIEGGDLYCALGKDFKMYYWENNHITIKDLAVLESDDTIVPIFFLIRLENFDIKNFFNGEMWKHVYVRIDQLRLPFIGTKSFYTFSGQKAFWDAIITLIKSLTAKDEGDTGDEG